MIGHIETVCFHCSRGREMIFASNSDAEWIHQTPDLRACYGKLIDNQSGSSILTLSPMKTGMAVIIGKMIPNRLGDNLSAYLLIPYGLDVPGNYLKGVVFDVISALEKNRRDVVSSCLSSISKMEFHLIQDFKMNSNDLGVKMAFRRVNSRGTISDSTSLDYILNNLFQESFLAYKYIFIAIDNQHIVSPGKHVDLSQMSLINWRQTVKPSVQPKAITFNPPTNEDSSLKSAGENLESGSVREYTSEWLKQNTEIHGWLSFFFFLMIIGGLVSAISPISTFDLEDYAGNICLGSVDIIVGLSLFGVAIYTVYCFTRRKSNALFWGRTYVILVFSTNLFCLLTNSMYGTGLYSNIQVVRGIIWGGVWFLYLSFSKQVKTVIPKNYRKVTKLDWTLLAVIIIAPMFLFTVGTTQINSMINSRANQETEMRNTQLAYNERTDGKIIFTIPLGFTCESQDVNEGEFSFPVFTINNDDIGNCSFCSAYDSDKSISNFDSYWEGWKDEEIQNYGIDNVDKGTISVNGNDCFYRITRHYVNGVYVYWRFYLLFDDTTGKVFVASFYDTAISIDYVNELLNSVRFK